MTQNETAQNYTEGNNLPFAVRHITQTLEFCLKINSSFCVKSLPARPCHSARQAAKAENVVSSRQTQNLPSS